MKQEVKIGQTDYTVLVLIRDTAGAPKTGLTNASAGIDVCYTRVETDNDVVLTAGAPVALATPALTDPHLDWGFLQVDATNAPGLYRLDIADGVFATGAWSAVVSLIATGIDPVHIEFVLVPSSPYTGVDVYSIGGTAQTANDNGADINDILVDTAVIGALGAGLTAIPWNATWDAEVQSEAQDAITASALATAANLAVVDGIVDDILVDTAVIGALGAGLTALSTQVSVDAIKAETALIVADTNELQTDDYPTSIAAVKADTAAILTDTGTTLDGKIDIIDDVLRNQMEITDANGNTVLYEDDSVTPKYSVNACVTDDATTTTRKRLA